MWVRLPLQFIWADNRAKLSTLEIFGIVLKEEEEEKTKEEKKRNNKRRMIRRRREDHTGCRALGKILGTQSHRRSPEPGWRTDS